MKTMRRSRVVTIIAWIGIVSGVLGTIASGMVALSAPDLATILWLASAVAGLVTSIGLLVRREWARRGLIAVLGYTVAMGFLQVIIVPLPAQLAGQVPDDVLQEARAGVRAAMLASALVFGAINGLIIAKLCTRRVREEFDSV